MSVRVRSSAMDSKGWDVNSEPLSFARRMQDIEQDTGYDTRRRVPEGVLAGVSQTTVYDTGVEADRGVESTTSAVAVEREGNLSR